MSTLYLPAPTQSTSKPPSSKTPLLTSGTVTTTTTTSTLPKQNAPSYEERCQIASNRSSGKPTRPPFCPRSLRDFDDGGAFPEIHVAQYPRHMGNPHLAKKKAPASTNSQRGGRGNHIPSGTLSTGNGGTILNVEIDADGDISYDAIVKSGTNSNKLVYTNPTALRGTSPTPDDLALPTPDEERATADRTAAALRSLVATKVQMDQPTGSARANAATSLHVDKKTEFVKYTPREDAPGYNPAAKTRVIQMVPAQLDPMAPPKHMHKKAPRGPAEDPVPVLHAPPVKLTKEEREAWNVPACISNWKNTRGYTIPLDKRLAADGRGLRDHAINEKFATLSESLYVAERQAREEVRMRSLVKKKLEVAEKERREQELRELANKARMERTSTLPPPEPEPTRRSPSPQRHATSHSTSHSISRSPSPSRQRRTRRSSSRTPPRISSGSSDEDDDNNNTTNDLTARETRDRLRIARKRERERELRLENLKGATKKQRLEDERDVSEKIALGIHTGGAGTLGGDVDSRLYNRNAGMDSGFGADDEYNAYTKPLFDRDAATKSIYKPTANNEMGDPDEDYEKLKGDATTRFQPDRGFAGAGGGGGGGGESRGGGRTKPVQFEKR